MSLSPVVGLISYITRGLHDEWMRSCDDLEKSKVVVFPPKLTKFWLAALSVHGRLIGKCLGETWKLQPDVFAWHPSVAKMPFTHEHPVW